MSGTVRLYTCNQGQQVGQVNHVFQWGARDDCWEEADRKLWQAHTAAAETQSYVRKAVVPCNRKGGESLMRCQVQAGTKPQW